MWIFDGPGKGLHFSNFSKHGLGRDGLWGHFEKEEAKRKTLSGVCGFVMVLARVIIFAIFSQHDLVRNLLGTILEKVKPREKPYQEYVDL